MSDIEITKVYDAMVNRTCQVDFSTETSSAKATWFYGGAANPIENKIFNNTTFAATANLSSAPAAVQAMQKFIGETRDMQTSMNNQQIANSFKRDLHRIQAPKQSKEPVRVTLYGEEVEILKDGATDNNRRKLEDLTIVYLLRFGAFDQGGSGRDPVLVGADAILAFIFKKAAKDTQSAAFYGDVAKVVRTGSGDVSAAEVALHEIRRVQANTQVVEQKLRSLKKSVKSSAVESFGILVLTCTILFLVYRQGPKLVMKSRTAMVLAASLVLVYVLVRMAWLHIPR